MDTLHRIVGYSRLVISLALILISMGRSGLGETVDGPLSPEKEAASFKLEVGLNVQLVAAEPLVVSPVALAFDERGRLFVAENRGYPNGPAEGKPPVGRIAMLEDLDGDGKMDRRSEFAEGLTFPNGVMPWKGGLIVTCAPDILYLKDLDGDGKADERTVLFTGFSTAGSTQLRVSHPTLSPDNWVYVTSGLTGGKVVSPRHPDRPAVELKRTDFRFRPDGETWEAAEGGSQFGLSFDDFGRRFICYNRVQVQHVVISSRVLRRNPHLAFSETVQNCPVSMVNEPLRGHGAAARLYPISRNVTTADSHAGTFTAACGVTIFRGLGLPKHYLGGAFSCDPTGNLVHFDLLDSRGASFLAHRWPARAEFLASTDNWFRPVFLAFGPDESLYIADMYRKTIEHPDYLPVEIRKRTDFEAGKTMGRIWRVVAADVDSDFVKKQRKANLGEASTLRLCEVLNNHNGYWRDTAHRLLLERRDPKAVEPLADLAGSANTTPETVVLALRLLASLDALSDDLLRLCLVHRLATVRENALQLVEPRLVHEPHWLEHVLPCIDDPDARVRFQAAITLGAFPGDDVVVAAALASIAIRDGADKWFRAAVFSSANGREMNLMRSLPGGKPLPWEMLTEFGRLLGSSRPKPEWHELVRLVFADKPGFPTSEQAALLTGLAESFRGRVESKDKSNVLMTAIGQDQELARMIRGLFARSTRTALDRSASFALRRTAIGLLMFADFDSSGETLLTVIDSQQPIDLQTAAVRALGAKHDPRVATSLLAAERFSKYTPALRDEVLSAVVAQAELMAGLLSALEAGQIPLGAIDALHRRQLTQSRDAEIRRRAEALFGKVAGDRARVYDEYKDVVSLKPDPAQGRAVFKRECASCHRLDRDGTAVGPDLFGIRNQPKESILLHILIPDQEITQGFTAYTVSTHDGRVLTGLLTSESPSSVTLRQPLGKEETILRSEIEELLASKQSLMPQGLEKNISRQEFADLLAYLKGEGPPGGE